MEAGSLDDDYDDECAHFMDLVVFCMIFGGFVWISWIPGARGRATHGTGLDGSRGPKETLQSWNLHSDD